jgi:hypothetical protein
MIIELKQIRILCHVIIYSLNENDYESSYIFLKDLATYSISGPCIESKLCFPHLKSLHSHKLCEIL